MRLIDAPVGLLMYDGCLVFKAEYSTAIQTGSRVTVTPDCYVVESGEYFWGGAKTAENRNSLDVKPIELPHVPTIAPKDPQPCGRWNDINPAVLKPGIAWVCRCSLCGCPQDHKHNYCPNCGARMREDIDHETD